MANINKIRISGSTFDIEDKNAAKTVTLTQAEYDALVAAGTVDSNTFYIITDAEYFDPSNYYTSAQTQSAITQAVSGKQDVSGMTAYTTTATTNTLSGTVTAHTADTTIHVTAQDKANWNNKSDFSGSYNDLTDKLSAGTNITIVDNVISAEGGGKAVAAGTNISVTTGTTADTISCKIPYSDVIYAKSDIILGKDMPSVSDYERVYLGKRIAAMANGYFSYSIGIGVPPSTNSSDYNELYGTQSIGIGGFKIGNGNQYSNLVSGCVAIGYGAKTRINNAVAIGKNTEASGTTKTNINNQLKIDTSNQIYIMDKDNANEICLQDYLGGGSSYTAGTGIDITNDVISVTGMVDTTTYSTYTAATDTALSNKQTTLTAGTGISIVDNVISATGGGGGGNVNVVELTQAQYDALTTIDPDTIYVITDAQGGDLANYYTKTETNTLLSGKIDTSAITTSITSSSTDAQVPSAKAVYDIVGDIETLLSQI